MCGKKIHGNFKSSYSPDFVEWNLKMHFEMISSNSTLTEMRTDIVLFYCVVFIQRDFNMIFENQTVQAKLICIICYNICFYYIIFYKLIFFSLFLRSGTWTVMVGI